MSLGGSNLGGGVAGVSPAQMINSYRSSGDAMTRRILRSSWNTSYATGVVNGHARSIGPFKAVSNIGDFLSRQDYVCDVPSAIQPNSVKWRSRAGKAGENCDGTGVPCSNTNTKFVPDSSDYIRYRRQAAMNSTYNDSSFGGDESNAGFVSMMRFR
jgi:hypothetical protein